MLTDLGHAIPRGSNMRITCNVAAATKPVQLAWYQDTYFNKFLINTVNVSQNEVTPNLWYARLDYTTFVDGLVGVYSCEVLFADQTKITREIMVNVKGNAI